ncbi:MAG: diguanylate cyclase [Chloroflexota bacterium]
MIPTPTKILIRVEDPQSLERLQTLLDTAGFETTSAATAAEVISMAIELHPEILLLDPVTPAITIDELCRVVKSNPKTRDTFIIFLTGGLSGEDGQRSLLAAGADGSISRSLLDRDILARLQAFVRTRSVEIALRLSDEKFRYMADSLPILIWLSGTDTLCYYFNQPWLDYTGRTHEQELGNGWAEGVHPDDFQRCLKIYLSSFELRQKFEMEYRLKQADGTYGWVLDRGRPRVDENGLFSGYIGSCMDITQLKTYEAELTSYKASLEEANKELRSALERESHLARTDALTGIHNRHYLLDLTRRELDISARYKQPLSVLMIDLDNFKHINDTFGHMAGDQVIQKAASIIRNILRSVDLFARFGGDEFVAVLPMTDGSQAQILAERIRQDIQNNPLAIGTDLVHFTVSIGISDITQTAGKEDRSYSKANMDHIFQKADEALYLSKTSGRNKVSIL